MELSSRPQGVSRKELPLNRDISSKSPPGPSMVTPSGDTGTTTSGIHPGTNIQRTIVE